MKDYTFWFSETYTYKGGFKARSLEEAEEMLSQLSEMELEELPGFWRKDKGYEFEFSPETIEEWD